MSTPAAGRSVLISGASRGIGAAVAEAFLALGDRVAALSRSGRAPAGALALSADVRDREQVDAAVGEAARINGPVEVLVANAGVTQDGLVLRQSDHDFAEAIEVNLLGAHRLTRAVLPGMVRGGGSCIYVSSVVAMSGAAGQASYAASKAGLIGFARSVAREYGRRGVRSNIVAPGFVRTDMTAALGPDAERTHVEDLCLARAAEPSEIAAAVAFLAGEGAGYITGAVLPVDGGMHLGH